MSRFNNRSVFRLAAGKEAPNEEWYTELRTTGLSGDCNEIAVSAKFIAFGGASARELCFLPVEGSGRFGGSGPPPSIAGTARGISSLDFSPFNGSVLATGTEDGVVSLWDLGDGSSNVAEPTVSVTSGGKRVQAMQFNPVAEAVLGGVTTDGTFHVWDMSAGASVFTVGGFDDAPQSIAWDYHGRTVVTTSKDKVVRVFDPRSNSEGAVMSGPCHEGIKASRVVWAGDSSRFITTGFDKYRSREIRVYDVAGSLDAPLSKTKLDSSSGVLMSLYDADTKLLFVGGKGDMGIRSYEDESGTLHECSTVGSREQTSGLALVPKSVMNVWDCEVARVIKLTSKGSLVPVSFKVPRKSYAKYHPELYPDTRGTTAGATAQGWAEGEDGTVALVSMQPEGERPTPTVKGSSTAASGAKTSSSGAGPSSSGSRNWGASSSSGAAAPKARKWSSGGSSKWGNSKRASWGGSKKIVVEEKKEDPDAPPEGYREVVVPKNVVRSSKYRHIVGAENKKDEWVTSLRIDDNFSVETSMIVASSELFAVPWVGAGGQIGVFPLSMMGRIETDAPVIAQTSEFNAMAFSPFNPNLLATGADNGKVALWDIPSEGLSEVMDTPAVALEGHQHRVTWVGWAPYVDGLAYSGSMDGTVRLWDVDAQAEVLCLNEFGDDPTDLAFAYDDTVLATAARDKVLRLHDPRSGGAVTASVENAHIGVKPFRVVWLGDRERLVTVGFGERSKRELKVWDTRNLAEPVALKPLTTSSNLALPFYDVQTGVLFLAGKGDGTINTFEINEKGIHELAPFTSTTPQAGLCMLPKAMNDVVACEFAQFVKLSSTNMSKLTFTVPRSRKEYFQDDVFVPAPGYAPRCTAGEWLGMEPAKPPVQDLRPEGMPLLTEFQAAEAAKKKPVKRWAPKSSLAPRDDRSNEEKVMDSFADNLKAYETDVLPQEQKEGAAEEDWVEEE